MSAQGRAGHTREKRRTLQYRQGKAAGAPFSPVVVVVHLCLGVDAAGAHDVNVKAVSAEHARIVLAIHSCMQSPATLLSAQPL